MYCLDETEADSQPDGWSSTIALADALKGCGSEAATIKVGGVTISHSEEEVHELDGAEHIRGNGSQYSQSLCG